MLGRQRSQQERQIVEVNWYWRLKNYISDVNRDSFKIKMKNKAGSNANANATEIVTLEELKIFIVKSTIIFFHVSFCPTNDISMTIK